MDLDATENEEEHGLSLQERLKLRTFVVASKTLAADPRWVKVSDVFNLDKTDAQLLRGLVKSFDNFSVLMEVHGDILIYKHAIASITSADGLFRLHQ